MQSLRRATLLTLAGLSLVHSAHAFYFFGYDSFPNSADRLVVNNSASKAFGAEDDLELLPNIGDVQGSAFRDELLDLAAGFETRFRYETAGGLGDGFAFLIASNIGTNFQGGGGQDIGYGDGGSDGIAIEFDFFDNGPGFWSSGIGDPPGAHISIQEAFSADPVNSLAAELSSDLFGTREVRIRYDGYRGTPGRLEIFVDEISQLAIDNFNLQDYFLDNNETGLAGFTGANGGAFGQILIKEWNMTDFIRPIRGVVTVEGFEGDYDGMPIQCDFFRNNEFFNGVGTSLFFGNTFAFTTNWIGSADAYIKVGPSLSQRFFVDVDQVNGFDFGPIHLSTTGDIDNDDAVTVFDYIELSSSFDLNLGDPGYNEMADLDGDTSITIFDYILLSQFFDRVGERPQ